MRNPRHPSYSTYSRHSSELREKVVPKQRRVQGQEKYGSNIGYLAYNLEWLGNECIFNSSNLGVFKCKALTDTGCFAYACIGDTFAQAFHQVPLPRPHTLKFYNGKISITIHLVKIRIKIANNVHQKNFPIFVTPGLH